MALSVIPRARSEKSENEEHISSRTIPEPQQCELLVSPRNNQSTRVVNYSESPAKHARRANQAIRNDIKQSTGSSKPRSQRPSARFRDIELPASSSPAVNNGPAKLAIHERIRDGIAALQSPTSAFNFAPAAIPFV